MNDDFRTLRKALLDLFEDGVDATPDDARFDGLARRVFELQFRSVDVYRAFCERRGVTPRSLHHWSEIPAVPTDAFKEVTLLARPADADSRVFRTSGTTRGAERRGTHVVSDPALYDASLVPTFQAFVLPDDARPVMLSLMPPAHELTDSSLAYMITTLLHRFGAPGSAHYASVHNGLDGDGVVAALRRAEADGVVVALLGTSLSFVRLLERMVSRGERVRLPEGSRLMDTGGYKGVGRRIEPAALRSLYGERLGIGPEYCVNEYGMTELCSQCYDTVLRDRDRDRDRGPGAGVVENGRRKTGPPWLRSRVVDPETLGPVRAGAVGILQHYDLANLGSVMAVQTADLAREVEGGFVLVGRASGAPPRGCSIAMDLLLSGRNG